MIEYNSKLTIYLEIIRKSFIELLFVDILLFILIANSDFFFLFPKPIKVFIMIFLTRKTLLNHTYTEFLEPLFIVAGGDIKRLVFINFFYNNVFFILTSLLLLAFNITTFEKSAENIFMLNLLIFVSFMVKFNMPIHQIKDIYIYKTLQIVIYYISFPLIIIIPNNLFNTIVLMLSFIFLVNYFNRTYNYYDSY